MRKRKEQRFIESVYPDIPDAWPRYVRTTVKINEETRLLCQQHLAERRADMEAERDNPALSRYHAAEILVLQAQIDHHTKIIQGLLALPPGPKWIKADSEKPRRLSKSQRGK